MRNYMVRSGEYDSVYSASATTETLPVEIACDPWVPVESIPTCSPMSLETVRVAYSHARASHTLPMAARRLRPHPVGAIILILSF